MISAFPSSLIQPFDGERRLNSAMMPDEDSLRAVAIDAGRKSSNGSTEAVAPFRVIDRQCENEYERKIHKIQNEYRMLQY